MSSNNGMDYGTRAEINGNGGGGGAKMSSVHSFTIEDDGAAAAAGDTTGLTHGSRARRRGGAAAGLCCPCPRGPSGSWQEDGLRLTVVCMFVFAIGVTVALIVHVAALHHGGGGGGAGGQDKGSQGGGKVVADNAECSGIGEKVLGMGGNAVDAAVATAVCQALVEPHVSGLGGGGVMLIHQHRKDKSYVVDFRETVPESASNDRPPASVGRTSVAVPGFVKGLSHAHTKYGSGKVGLQCCSWTHLVYLSISHALKQGVELSKSLSTAVTTKITDVQLAQADSAVLKQFVDEVKGLGDAKKINVNTKTFQNVITTLETLANHGPEDFYKGGIAAQIENATGGMVNKGDLESYKVEEREVISTKINNYKVLTAPAPTAGPKLLTFLNAMEEDDARQGSQDGHSFLQRVANMLVDLKGLQLALGDPKIQGAVNPEVKAHTEWMINKVNLHTIFNTRTDQGVSWSAEYTLRGGEPVASNVASMDSSDNYVVLTASINTWFGSNIMTEGGVLLNNALANFYIPGDASVAGGQVSTANTMAFGQRPLTRNVVALAMDTADICGSRYLFGGSTADSVGQVMSRSLLDNWDMKKSVDGARLLYRNSTVFYEGAVEDPAMEEFSTLHGKYPTVPLELPYASVNGLDKNVDKVLAYSDIRNQFSVT